LSYVIYAKGVASRFSAFAEELLSDLARRGIKVSNYGPIPNGVAMSIRYTDETGDMSIVPFQADVQVSYTASGGPETLKGAMTGAASGGGLGVLAGIMTGRSDKDKVAAGVAGAITGGALGTYRGHEKGMREGVSFARVLAMSVTQAERKMLDMERKEQLGQTKRASEKEGLLREKSRLESQTQQMLGEVESLKSEEESKKIEAEANHMRRSTQLEERYQGNKDLLEKMLAAESKRYEAELKNLEAIYGRRRSLLESRIADTEGRIKLLTDKLETA
jgi:hypothetical protein